MSAWGRLGLRRFFDNLVIATRRTRQVVERTNHPLVVLWTSGHRSLKGVVNQLRQNTTTHAAACACEQSATRARGCARNLPRSSNAVVTRARKRALWLCSGRCHRRSTTSYWIATRRLWIGTGSRRTAREPVWRRGSLERSRRHVRPPTAIPLRFRPLPRSFARRRCARLRAAC